MVTTRWFRRSELYGTNSGKLSLIRKPWAAGSRVRTTTLRRATRRTSGRPAALSGQTVHGQDCEGGVEGGVAERQRHRYGLHDRGGARRALSNHRHRWLDGKHVVPIGWLVRTRAGTDVHDGDGVVQRRPYGVGDARIGLADIRIAASDGVVERNRDDSLAGAGWKGGVRPSFFGVASW